MRPVIGIVTRPQHGEIVLRIDAVTNMMRRAVLKNGGIPIGILPSQDLNYIDLKREDMPKLTDDEKEIIVKEISMCDGIILQGGNRWYEYDEFIVNYIIEHDIPALMICMSMQLLNSVDFLNNDMSYILEEVGGHRSEDDYVHEVNIKEDSILYKILGKNKINVNSLHRYAIKDTLNYDVIASSTDGIPEAISVPNKKFILGLQWHPEKMIDFDDDANKIIKYFIDITKSH